MPVIPALGRRILSLRSMAALAIYSKMREKRTDLSMELMMKREAKQRDF
jgi:hypothetical protein